MQFTQNKFSKPTLRGQNQLVASLMDAVQQGVGSLPTQMETPIRAARPREIGRQIHGAVLRTCNTLKPTRFNHNGCQTTEEVRHHSLFTRTVNELQMELLQELHPTHLAGRQMGLRFQMGQGSMIGDHSGALAVNVVPPFLDPDNNCKQFPLVRSIIAQCTSQLLAVVCDRL